MTRRPSYKELEQRVKELEKEASKQKEAGEELRTYQFMIESARDAIFFKDLESRYIVVNDKTLEAFGLLSKEDVIGKNDYELMPNQQEAETNVHDDQIVFKSGKPAKITKHMTGANGKEYWFQAIKAPKFDNNGKVIGLVGIARDITNRKRAAQALRESEKRYRLLVETMNDGIGIKDENGLITYVNNAFCRMLGYKLSDFIGKPVMEFLDDHNRQILKNQTSVRKKGKAKPYEIEWTSKDGRKIQTIMSPQAIFNDNGQFKGSFSVITDISTLKQTEEALRESEERYRSLAENSLVGFWQTTLDGYSLYINPAMCAMLEIESPEELSGQTYHSFYDAKSLNIIKRELVKRQKGLSSSYEVVITGKNGTRRNVMISGSPILSAKGELQSVIATFTDISDLKKVEKALQKAHDKLEYRVKERTEELEIKTKSLEELNTAMKVLLKKRKEDKKEMEDNLLTNTKEIIEPYIKKIKKTRLDDQQKALLTIVESNLNEIISPFIRKMSMKYLNLTPTEIQIANLIKHGSPSKKIAELMNVSPRTIDTHRKNIRRKIGLQGQRGNLRSYLLSLH